MSSENHERRSPPAKQPAIQSGNSYTHVCAYTHTHTRTHTCTHGSCSPRHWGHSMHGLGLQLSCSLLPSGSIAPPPNTTTSLLARYLLIKIWLPGNRLQTHMHTHIQSIPTYACLMKYVWVSTASNTHAHRVHAHTHTYTNT